MKNKNNLPIVMLTAVLFLVSPYSGVLFAQQRAQPAKSSAAPQIEGERDEIKGAPLIIGAGGGYFIPFNDAGGMFSSNWCARLFLQKNNIEDTLFGIGLDISYATLPDIEYDGSIIYGTIFPYITSTFEIFLGMNAQLKTGVGFTALISGLNSSKNADLSLTPGAGLGIYRVFGQHFFAGIEANYYYYFLIHSSSALGMNLYMGYRF